MYCRYCGSKLVEKKNGFYDEETGEAEVNLVCPTDPCRHSFHHDWVDGGFFSKILGAPKRCSRCGVRLFPE